MHYVKGKGYFESSGRKVCSARTMALRLARVYGYENDTSRFTRLFIENRVRRDLMEAAFRAGRALAENNQPKPA